MARYLANADSRVSRLHDPEYPDIDQAYRQAKEKHRGKCLGNKDCLYYGTIHPNYSNKFPVFEPTLSLWIILSKNLIYLRSNCSRGKINVWATARQDLTPITSRKPFTGDDMFIVIGERRFCRRNHGSSCNNKRGGQEYPCIAAINNPPFAGRDHNRGESNI